MSIKDVILRQSQGIKSQQPEDVKIETFLNSLLYLDDEKREERTGMHGSAVIAIEDKFCFREQVLSFFFKSSDGEKQVDPKLKRIFLEGWSVHEKWQGLFRQAGIDRGIEQRGYSKEYELFFTPDAIIEIDGEKYVVEIKSVNDYQFKNMTSHPSGEKQLQLYMHFVCIYKGFVLCENKNTQEIKIFSSKYNFHKVAPYLERMKKVLRFKRRFIKTGKLPSKICSEENCSRAAQCNYSGACFSKRIPLDKKQYKKIKSAWAENQYEGD